jgi:hypothetical protein
MRSVVSAIPFYIQNENNYKNRTPDFEKNPSF